MSFCLTEVLTWRTPRNTTLWDEMKSKYIEHIQSYYVKLCKTWITTAELNIRYIFFKGVHNFRASLRLILTIFQISCTCVKYWKYTSVVTYSGDLLGLQTTDSTSWMTISFQGCVRRLTNIAMQHRTSPTNKICERTFSFICHALAGKKYLLPQTSKPIITLEGERSFQKVQTKVTDNAKIKLNDCRLHRAAQIYRTCNWKEMQNERGLALFGHTRFRNGSCSVSDWSANNTDCKRLETPAWKYHKWWQEYNMFEGPKRERTC